VLAAPEVEVEVEALAEALVALAEAVLTRELQGVQPRLQAAALEVTTLASHR
jgi:hypothetical protein